MAIDVPHGPSSKTFGKIPKVFFSCNAGTPHVGSDDKNVDFLVGGDDYWTQASRFVITPVTAFLPFKLKAGLEKDAFKHFPWHRRYAWQCSASG